MPSLRRLATAALALTLAVGASNAAYACTDAQATAKLEELTNALTALMSRNPSAAGPISQAMTEVMMSGTVTPQTCTRLDQLIAQAKR